MKEVLKKSPEKFDQIKGLREFEDFLKEELKKTCFSLKKPQEMKESGSSAFLALGIQAVTLEKVLNVFQSRVTGPTRT